LSLAVEAALVVLSAGMLLTLRQRPPSAAPSAARPHDSRPRGGTQIMMLTAVTDAAAAGEQAIAAAGHDGLPPRRRVSDHRT
jgi:hypothetical protein